VNEVSSSWRK